MFVLDSISRDNGGDGFSIAFAAASRVTIDSSRFENNGQSGIRIESGDAAISRSTASGNATRGIDAGNASVNVVSTMAVQNGQVGFRVDGGGIMRIESSVATDNNTALSVASGSTAIISNSAFTGINSIFNNGTVRTRGNNTVAGASFGPLTPLGGV